MAFIKLPGLIDPHVHLRDPGQTEKEDFYTGTSAALAGGYTTIIDMPNNQTPITTLERLEKKEKIAKEKIACDVGFYFGSLGNNLDEFEKAQQKVMGIKLYLNETTGNFLIDKDKIAKIFKTWGKDKPILLHAEHDAVAYCIEITKKTGNRIHFCHINNKNDLKQIIKAKNEGLLVTCGVTPHHLFLNENDQKTLGAYGAMKPPLGTKKDVEFLWKHLSAIDVIESDHAPHTKEEKTDRQPRDDEAGSHAKKTPYGVPGLETILPLLLTAVSEHRLTIDDLIRLCHTNPSRIFGVKISSKTYIEIDAKEKYEINEDHLYTKCKWSPFDGWKVKGKVVRVFIREKKVFENDKILAEPGSGEIIKPQ